MRILFRQFLGGGHSWSDVGHNLAREYIKLGNDVDLISTNGYDHFPEDLKGNIVENPGNDYDCQISYTAPPNAKLFLSSGSKNRFHIWNSDSSIIPKGFIKYCNDSDKFMPSSEFSKNIFVQNGLNPNHIEVVPHGIDVEKFKVEPFKFNSKRKIKILSVVGQLHHRKNLDGILNAFGKAFTKNDDVCLILKIVPKSKDERERARQVNFNAMFQDFLKAYPNHAPVEIIADYVKNIESLFVAADIIISMSNFECFHIPSLQGLAAKKIVLASNWGGNVDFMNDKNSFLIEGKEVRAPFTHQYWEPSVLAKMFEPSIDDAAEKLRNAAFNYDKHINSFMPNIEKTLNEFTWANAANKILKNIT